MKYVKVWFESKDHGKTAGLILKADDSRLKDVVELSRMFPYSEALKMESVYISEPFDTWEEAFNYNPGGTK